MMLDAGLGFGVELGRCYAVIDVGYLRAEAVAHPNPHKIYSLVDRKVTCDINL